MPLKFAASFVFMLFFTTAHAQVMYSQEEIQKRYDHETIILHQNSFEKNGKSTRLNPFFPSPQLRTEIEKDGGFEAVDQFKKYKKTLGIYWLIWGLGCVGLIVFLATLAGPLSQAGYLLYLLGVTGWALLGMYYGRKAYSYLVRSIWYHNRHVLLRNPTKS